MCCQYEPHIAQLGTSVQILTEEGEQVPSTMNMMMAMIVTMVMMMMVILFKRWNRTKLLSSLWKLGRNLARKTSWRCDSKNSIGGSLKPHFLLIFSLLKIFNTHRPGDWIDGTKYKNAADGRWDQTRKWFRDGIIRKHQHKKQETYWNDARWLEAPGLWVKVWFYHKCH